MSLRLNILFALLTVTLTGCDRVMERKAVARNPDIVYQLHRNTCGPAALVMILRHHSISATTEDLKGQMTLNGKGVSMSDMVRTSIRLGVKAEGIRCGPEALRSLPLPAILWIDQDHFVVIDSIRGDTAEIRDPAEGFVRLARKQLLARWSGEAIIFGGRTGSAPP